MAKNFGELENILKTAARKGEETKGIIVKEINLSEIRENDSNFFNMDEDTQFKSLVESIKDYGVMHPITVQKEEEGKYKIISGHRRYRASERAGKKTIPAIICSFDDPQQSDLAMLDANFTSRVLAPSDIAAAIKFIEERLQGENIKGRKRDYIGKLVGLSGQQVERYKAFTKLDPEVQQMIEDEKLALTAAPYIAKLSPEEQKQAAAEIIQSEVKDTRKAAKQAAKKIKQPEPDDEVAPCEPRPDPEADKQNPTQDSQDERNPEGSEGAAAIKEDRDRKIITLNNILNEIVQRVRAIDNKEAIQILDEAIKILQKLTETGSF